MSLTDDIVSYAQHQYGEEEGTQETTEIVATEPTEETPVVDEVPANAEIVATATTETQEQVQEPTIDYNAILSELSGGKFSDVEAFKGSLTKFDSYDELEKTKAELEEKLKVDPFANEFTKKLNEGIKSGWDTDKIQNFIKINSVDFDKMTPKELKVANMVLNQGYSEEIALKIVEKNFAVDDYEEGSDDRRIIEEELRISSNKDLQELQAYKAELSKVENKDAEIAEQNRLAEIANQAKYKEDIKQLANVFAPKLTGLGETTLREEKDGKEAVKMNFAFDDEFKKALPSMVEQYFDITKAQPTQESLDIAEHSIKADYLYKNFDKIVKQVSETMYAKGTEDATNKYENRSGLPTSTENQNVDNTAVQQYEFLERVANRQLN